MKSVHTTISKSRTYNNLYTTQYIKLTYRSVPCEIRAQTANPRLTFSGVTDQGASYYGDSPSDTFPSCVTTSLSTSCSCTQNMLSAQTRQFVIYNVRSVIRYTHTVITIIKYKSMSIYNLHAYFCGLFIYKCPIHKLATSLQMYLKWMLSKELTFFK